ncbi:MAG: hypothetical protein BWK73_44455 [Thiothrix lacustris]|uniref:Uncharacterized protein n=2 Tax=Thiothrix TaxID=1030 RepID=A0A975FBG9_9GAMM|nr:hypothetical protein [Thiothrix unzii]OQX01919.1 MAG: hypothetical protein BWK73_44455 [Thiothrix lacustris]QTR53910.1 hypothetical protein J9260_02130 [Thiothrix unzii]
MYAVEFEASINDGMFKIPETFRKLQSVTKAKIIIMIEDELAIPQVAVKKIGFIERLANNPIHVDRAVKFLSREEANER